jgi:hypothetical protein
MQTKVFRVSCVAGIPLDRAPQTPIKKVTVYLPGRRSPNDAESSSKVPKGGR